MKYVITFCLILLLVAGLFFVRDVRACDKAGGSMMAGGRICVSQDGRIIRP